MYIQGKLSWEYGRGKVIRLEFNFYLLGKIVSVCDICTQCNSLGFRPLLQELKKMEISVSSVLYIKMRTEKNSIDWPE